MSNCCMPYANPQHLLHEEHGVKAQQAFDGNDYQAPPT